MRNGGEEILTDGNHLLKMEIRPYVNTDSIKTGNIIASGELLLEVVRKPKIEVRKIKTKSDFINAILKNIAFIKIPAPTIEFNRFGNKAYWFYI